jgi:hypothetical protein
MTTTAQQTTSTDTTTRTRGLAALGIVTSLIATATGTFLDLTNNEPTTGQDDDASVYLIVVGMTLVVALIAFGLVVRTAARGNASRRAAITGVGALLSVAVFWTGAPLVLVAATVACALVDRDKIGSMGAGSKVGLVFATFTAAAAVWLAIAG